MIHKILAINPGSTSTKAAIYENDRERYTASIEHSTAELACYQSIADQYEMRREAVLAFLEQNKVGLHELAAVVGRGGLLPPVESGAYLVNEAMVRRLTNSPIGEHPSNLGGIIAYEIAKPLKIPAYIYDPVSVDELQDVARLTGFPEIHRRSLIHALNMRAAAIKTAAKLGKPYPELTLIVVHLGGGISLSIHKEGRMIDIISDDEGPMAPERAGRLPAMQLMELSLSGQADRKALAKKLRGQGGLVAHLGTNKALEVEERIKKGDKKAELVYSAMAYQVAKGIGELATVVCGKVDGIVITGGIAYSDLMTGWIKERVGFIAPVEILPGENELESLVMGALRVLQGREKAREYQEQPDS